MATQSYCRECDRAFYVVDAPDLYHSYRCPVCLFPGVLNPGEENEYPPQSEQV
jgi:hypothetical protein